MRKISLLISVLLLAVIAGACVGGPPSPPPDPGPHRGVVMFGDSNGWGIGCYLGHEGIAGVATAPLPCNPQADFSTQNESLGAGTIAGGPDAPVQPPGDRAELPPTGELRGRAYSTSARPGSRS
jgi:hypothetical protein